MTVGSLAAAPVAGRPGPGARALAGRRRARRRCRAARSSRRPRRSCGCRRPAAGSGSRRRRASAPARARRRARGTRRCWCRPCRTTPRRGTRTPRRRTAAARTPADRARQQQRGRSPHRVVERARARRPTSSPAPRAPAPRARRGTARQTGRSVGVGDRGDQSLVLAELGRDLVRAHHVATRRTRAPARPRVRGPRFEVGVQQADRDHIDVVDRREPSPSNGFDLGARPVESATRPRSRSAARARGPAVGRRAGRRATAAPGARSR